MKKINIITGFIALILSLGSCQEDFLDRTPLDEVGQPVFFRTPDDLKTYVNQFYTSTLFPIAEEWGSDVGMHGEIGTDNAIYTTINVMLNGNRTLDGAGSIDFSQVRAINYFFDYYQRVEATAAFSDYQQYVGEAHFFRALIYFNLLKQYGDIQWYTTALETNSPELYKARDPRNIVADNIIADLDTAAMYLTEDRTDGASRLNKWMALYLQTQVALFEGTWEKYHAGDPFGVSSAQPARYLNKAVEAASLIMNSGLYDVYSTGKPLEDYYDLLSTLQSYASNPEILFWKEYNNDLMKGEEIFRRQRNYGMYTPYDHTFTKELADAYLCTDGKPVSVSSLFLGYDSLNMEKQNRDSRFYQTIATPDAPWTIKEDGSVILFRELYNELNNGAQYNASCGYLMRKYYDAQEIHQVPQYEETPGIIMRYAVILLNYAEAKAELGTLTQSDIDISIKKLRDRVGMPNLDLSNITTDPDWDFPALSPVINEIRRERRVELASEGERHDDIMRWAAADELILGKRPRGLMASQLKNNVYPVDPDGFLDPYLEQIPGGYGFKIDRDYLDAIPKDQFVLNPDLTQNPGWE